MATLRKNALEWAVFAISLVLVLAVVGTLAVEATEDADGPPRLIVATEAPQSAPSGVRVPVTVRNDGAQTVASVVVEVTDGAETTEVTFAYVPRHSTRTGGAFFATPPGRLTARVVSYEAP